MRIGATVLVAAAAMATLVLGWGYWYSSKHAALHLRVDDYGLRSDRQAYGTPHDVALTLRDRAGTPLAVARSVEPLGYILAVHPSAEIGNCEHRGIRPSSDSTAMGDYPACYTVYSAWSATWARQVVRADVRVGSCEVLDVPVAVHRSNDEWLLWWVPLPHVGGLPRRYFEFVVAVDSRACEAVDRSARPDVR